ncbi:MAG: PDZ domain-containing protein [Gemmatimonas sp.]
MTKSISHLRTLAPGALLLLSPLVQSATAQGGGTTVLPRTSAEARARAEELRRGVQPPRIVRVPGADWMALDMEGNGARLGVTTAISSNDKGDTLGVLVQSVTAGSPADKAGIKEGARITSINGVSLRVPSQDVGDPEFGGAGQRRLVREMGKVKIGDEVQVRVANGSSTETLRIKTVGAQDLLPTRVASAQGISRTRNSSGASLGVSLGSSGSVRDTLGIFITSVSAKGPAESAGIVEGDRIAAINGIDVRVPREDAEDAQASMARVNRLQREVGKLTAGDKATLRVYSGGRYREVVVTTGSGGDAMMRGFQFNTGDGMRMFSFPRGVPGEPMELENLLQRMREGLNGDSTRVYYRRPEPSANRGTFRRVSPVRVRSSSGQ